MIIDELLTDLQTKFRAIPDGRAINAKLELPNILMGGFAVFSLKDSSLLEYVNRFKERKKNLKTVYGITQCPSDTAMREILDDVAPGNLQNIAGEYITLLSEEGYLSPYELRGDHLSNHLYIPIDGVQYFESKNLSCSCCLTKNHKNGTCTYHHNALTAVIVHPDISEVLVVASEEIKKQDGEKKNDHELCAAGRLVPLIRKGIKDRKAILGGDSLFANAPFIRLAQSHDFNFLLRIKEGYQGYPFIQFNKLVADKRVSIVAGKNKTHTYRHEFANDLILNGDNQDIKVNFVRLTEQNIKTGEITTFDWITDIKLSIKNIMDVAKTGRARWKIENETFNTLKNQGYHYEHNFGHGKKYLAQNFAQLMLLAFLFDQIQHIIDPLFRKALIICKSKKVLWARVREIFNLIPVLNMESIYKLIAKLLKLNVELSI